jgi:hypothetical protein
LDRTGVGPNMQLFIHPLEMGGNRVNADAKDIADLFLNQANLSG